MKLYQIILLAIFIVIYGCKEDVKKDEAKSPTSKSDGGEKPMTVNGIIAKNEFTKGSISTSGTILANEEVDIKCEVMGKITGIYFKEGQPVSKGQLLLKLNDDDLQAQLRKLGVEIKLAEEKEKRQSQLLASAAISKEEYDISLSNLNLLKANVDILKTDIGKTRITSPFTGIAGLKHVSPGAFITSSTIITTVQSIQPLKLEFSVPEKYNGFLKSGTSVDFRVAGTSEQLKATIYAKEPKIDPVTRTVKIRASFPNPSGRISPGSFADINLSIGDKVEVIMIPTMAFIPDIAGAKVFVVKNGKAMSVPVKAGIRTESSIQIIEGISQGDTILTTGILQLKPKSPVNVNIVQ